MADLTSAGLLQKQDDIEVELIARENDCELRSGVDDPMVAIGANGQAVSTHGKAWVDRKMGLTVTITTHRIVLMQQTSDKRVNARYIHLSHVLAAVTENQLFKSPKIILDSYSGEFLLVFKGKEANKDRDAVLYHIQKALSRQDWETADRAAQHRKAVANLTSRKVGVDAVLAKHKTRHAQAARLTDSAFDGDAETLLREAHELVAVIHKYVATLDKQKEVSSQDEQDATRLADLLQNMGMTSALSKANFLGSEDAYYTQLARQLADFLEPHLHKAGGILTLTDVYCLFNRARGTNLISPEDLTKAASQMDALSIGMSRRVFPSGLIVIQDDSFDDHAMAEKLQALALDAPQGLTETEASRQCQISALLAHEELLAAERMGILVRDETLESTRFFPNRFEAWADIQ